MPRFIGSPPTLRNTLRTDHGWEQYEHNQALLADNAHMKSRMEPKAGRGGRSLLAGLLRCRRCGRMLHVAYSGSRGEVPRYHCRGAQLNHGEAWCISFGGLRPDRAVTAEILKAVVLLCYKTNIS